MNPATINSKVESAMRMASFTQRELADATGISQSTISRIVSGERSPKMPEIIKIADALGLTVPQLTGSAVAKRTQIAARATNGSAMSAMKKRLTYFLELDEHLEDQAIFVS